MKESMPTDPLVPRRVVRDAADMFGAAPPDTSYHSIPNPCAFLQEHGALYGAVYWDGRGVKHEVRDFTTAAEARNAAYVALDVERRQS